MLGLHWLDWLALLAYFALTTWIGLLAARKVKGASDYFMGGRRFGRAYMVAHALGTGTSTEQPVTVAGASSIDHSVGAPPAQRNTARPSRSISASFSKPGVPPPARLAPTVSLS